MTSRGRISGSVLFTIATAFGVSSTIQAYWLQRLSKDMAVTGTPLRLLILNLVYWYVPALSAPVIMALATRYQLGRVKWPVQALVHVPGALVYASLHSAAMLATRVVLFPGGPVASGCWPCVARESLQQLDWQLMTYLFLVGLAHALAYRRESEARALNASQLETRLVEAQLQALQRQVHPHFLFNTLNTISGLMRSNLNAADLMIDQLGDLLRMTLNASGAQVVSLKDELDVLQKYLEIEQTRFGGRLSIAMRIDPETLDALVPNLILQPLVENAVRHGVAPHARPGWIVVRAVRTADRLLIEIRDSGNGLSPERLKALNQGVGLSNTRARLEHLYRSNCQFKFSNLPEGFLVAIDIPYQSEPAADTVRAGVA